MNVKVVPTNAAQSTLYSRVTFFTEQKGIAGLME